ncbi:MAG: TlpA disulfide reductase family protein [Pseudomonadota bacterium]
MPVDRFLRLAIPTMFAGIAIGLLYAVFSATSDGSNRDRIARLAIGDFVKLDFSDRGADAPSAPFADAEGDLTTYQDFEGQALVVNFWATYCAPCIHEMPTLAALQTSRGGEDFKVVTISVDIPEVREDAEAMLRELSGGALDFYALADGPQGWDVVYESGATGGFPTTVLYNKAGTKIAKLEGIADWAGYEAVALVDALREN